MNSYARQTVDCMSFFDTAISIHKSTDSSKHILKFGILIWRRDGNVCLFMFDIMSKIDTFI